MQGMIQIEGIDKLGDLVTKIERQLDLLAENLHPAQISYSESQAAKLLGLKSPTVLYRMVSSGTGPKFFIQGKKRMYSYSSLLEYIASQPVYRSVYEAASIPVDERITELSKT